MNTYILTLTLTMTLALTLNELSLKGFTSHSTHNRQFQRRQYTLTLSPSGIVSKIFLRLGLSIDSHDICPGKASSRGAMSVSRSSDCKTNAAWRDRPTIVKWIKLI